MAGEYGMDRGIGGFFDLLRAVPEGAARRKEREKEMVIRAALEKPIVDAAARGESPFDVGSAAELRAMGLLSDAMAAQEGGRFGGRTRFADRENVLPGVENADIFGAQAPDLNTAIQSLKNLKEFQALVSQSRQQMPEAVTQEPSSDPLERLSQEMFAKQSTTPSQVKGEPTANTATSRKGLDSSISDATPQLFDIFLNALQTGQLGAAGTVGNMLITSESARGREAAAKAKAAGGAGATTADWWKEVDKSLAARGRLKEQSAGSIQTIQMARDLAQRYYNDYQKAVKLGDNETADRIKSEWAAEVSKRNKESNAFFDAPQARANIMKTYMGIDPNGLPKKDREKILHSPIDELAAEFPDFVKQLEQFQGSFWKNMALDPALAYEMLDNMVVEAKQELPKMKAGSE